MKLYEIKKEYEDALEIENEEERALAISKTNELLENKVENIGKYLRNIDIDAESLDQEIKRLSARKNSMINKKESIKKFLMEFMLMNGFTKIKTPLLSFTVSDCQPSVRIEDESVIPDEYKVVSYTISKTKIKEALEKGGLVKGASLITNKSLRIL